MTTWWFLAVVGCLIVVRVIWENEKSEIKSRFNRIDLDHEHLNNKLTTIELEIQTISTALTAKEETIEDRWLRENQEVRDRRASVMAARYHP